MSNNSHFYGAWMFITKSSWSEAVCTNIAYLLVYTVKGRNPLPTPRTKLELYPLSDFRDCLF